MKINWLSCLAAVAVVTVWGHLTEQFIDDPVAGIIAAAVGGFLLARVWHEIWPFFREE